MAPHNDRTEHYKGRVSVNSMDADIEARLGKLEEAVFGKGRPPQAQQKNLKQVALSQLSRSELLSNGQKKVALIIGYNELVLHEAPISLPSVRNQWIAAKFKGKCDAKLLERAIVDGFVRDPDSNNLYDLTRDGEDFVNEVLAKYDEDRKEK